MLEEGTSGPVQQKGEEQQDLEYLRECGRLQVVQEVEKLSWEEKQAYLEALDKAPQVCKAETDPLVFLRKCDYNAASAAKVLCTYWKERLELFGPERAFLPLLITGKGALTKQDVLSFQSGWPAVLPCHGTTGLPVVFFDIRNLHPTSTVENRLRSMFYLAHVSVNYPKDPKNDLIQTHGFYILHQVTMPRRGKPSVDSDGRLFEFHEKALELCRLAFPVKLKKFFALIAATPTKMRYDSQHRITRVVDIHFENQGTQDDLEVLFERPAEDPHGEGLDLLSQLRDMGFTPEGLPLTLGGTWPLKSECAKWYREQGNRDRQLYTARQLNRAMEAVRAQPPDETTSTMGKGKEKSLVAQPPAQSASGGDKKSRRRARLRELNVIYSRKKREQEKQLLLHLKQQSSELSTQRMALLAEQERLERLVKQADQLLSSM